MLSTATASTPESTLNSESLRPLQRLVGTWRGDGTIRMGEQSAPVQLEWAFAACAGGYGVEGSLVVLGIPGVERCLQKDLLGYDAADGKLRWISVCSSEEFHDRRGSIDGTALVVSDPSERIRVRFLDDRRIAVDITADKLSAEAILTR
jgi:hypothetical protein